MIEIVPLGDSSYLHFSIDANLALCVFKSKWLKTMKFLKEFCVLIFHSVVCL